LAISGFKAPDPSILSVASLDRVAVRQLDAVVDRALALSLMATCPDVSWQEKCSHNEAFAFVNKFIVCYRAGGLFTTREKKFL
jgi:hypothetical protein